MIQKTRSYTTTDGTIHATIEQAREHELLSLTTLEIDNSRPTEVDGFSEQQVAVICKFMVANAEAIIDLLTTKATSRPAARKSNRKKAAAKAEVVA